MMYVDYLESLVCDIGRENPLHSEFTWEIKHEEIKPLNPRVLLSSTGE